jgi:hypothetical protein
LNRVMNRIRVNNVILFPNSVKDLSIRCITFPSEINTYYHIMNKKIILRILIGITSLIILIKFVTLVFAEPWARKKTEAELNEKNTDYLIEIHRIHISVFLRRVELENITISPKQRHAGNPGLTGKIAFVKIKGISIAKAIFKKDISIRDITISNSSFKGKISLSGEAAPSIKIPVNIRIGKILLDKTDLAIETTSGAQSFSVKEGVLKVYELEVEKNDTLSTGIFKKFDFKARELVSVSHDSMYSFTVRGLDYSAISNTLSADSFSIHPNYEDYDFTSRYEFQTSRFEAGFSNIDFHNFRAADYLRTKSLISSYIKIGKMDMKVFRDKRKEFRHVNKPAFQDMIYNYPGTIRIDSIGLINGDIIFTTHAEEANEPGSISFNDINARIRKITNDTIYKTKKAILELKANALLMGKAKIAILLKGRIYDSNNTFSVNGTLSELEANELNPILEKNAFIYATSGTIDGMSFNFTANNTNSDGNLTILYHGLDIAVKNKRTDDTTAFRERFISFIANRKVIDSNPVSGNDVREGTIEYERDPERFLFHYCFRSILSGIQTSLVKNPNKGKNKRL